MSNLRDRLRRIQAQKKSEAPKNPFKPSFDISVLVKKGWQPCGFNVLKRVISKKSPVNVNVKLPQALSIIVPDLEGKDMPSLKDFLFFDLETTGLSGGAGTVAFLAAFGRFCAKGKLVITQYLLLDYPGEPGFIESVVNEITNEQQVIVSYNGKCFDSQILNTRCLMNGIKPPVYPHVDLLHPARRLWKRIISDCSQSSVETQILRLDRTGDIPGSLAPEIWFEFLKTGRTDRLTGICDHNTSDIYGLASILAEMIFIAGDPFNKKHRYDIERLALYWRFFCRRNSTCNEASSTCSEASSTCSEASSNTELSITGEKLLRIAAKKDYQRAVYVYSFDLMRKGNYMEALEFVNRGLEIIPEDSRLYDVLSRRKLKLLKRIE